MTCRLGLPLVLVLLATVPSFATVGREITGGDGGPPPPRGGSPPPFLRPGFAEEEPYRNADKGPLGVVLSNGEFQTTVTDLEIPGRGMSLQLTRTYRSKKDSSVSFLGWNWHLSYDEYLKTGTFVDAGGASHLAIQWTMGNGWREVWVDAEDTGKYRAFGGFFGKLRSLGLQGYQIRYANGTVKTFGQTVQRPGMGPVWALTRIEDRNGNAVGIRFKPGNPSTTQVIDSLTDTLGRKIILGYDDQNRLTSATDFAGRRIDYLYDLAGNLSQVKAPEVRFTPNGNDFCDSGCPQPRKTTRYAYASACGEPGMAHNLLSITDGKGQVFLTNRFYSSSGAADCGPLGGFPDYLASQVYGGGTVAYDYLSFYAPPDAPADVRVLTTTVTDRNGNIEVHDFNNQGNPLRIEHKTNRGVRRLAGSDEPDYVETFTYVDHGTADRPMLIANQTKSGGLNVSAGGHLVAYTSGTTTQYNYDQNNDDPFQRGNLLSVEVTPGARGGGQPSLTTSYTYEPLFNQPRTITDPRGHASSLTYDYQEGTYGDLTANVAGGTAPPVAVNPAWWTNHEIQDYLGTMGNGNAGDLNGDGYHRGGNLIRASEGVATNADGTVGEEIAAYFAYNSFGLPVTRRDAEYNETRFLYFAENDPDGDGMTTPAPADGRSLSGTAGAMGGGYLQQRIQDATPTMPMPSPAPAQGRDSGQNPSPRNMSLIFAYDPVGNIRTATDGRGIRTDYAVNALNQIVQVIHAAASSDPLAPSFGFLEQFTYDANNNVVRHRSERRDDGSTVPSGRWITMNTTYDLLDRKLTETVSTDDLPAISLTTRYAYDGNGNLVKTVFPAGNVMLRKYDERDLLYQEAVLKDCTETGGRVCDSYDAAVDSVTTHDYDGSGNVIQLTDPEGRVAHLLLV